MILVAFLHGLRVSEVLALTPDNIVDGHLDVRRRKGSNRTKQPLFTHENPLLSVRDPLIAFSGKLRKASRLFPISRATFWRRMQHYAEAAGLPKTKAHPHVLKHSIAMQLIDSAGIHRTQAWLGHKSMASTGAYLKPSDDDVAAAAKRALDG